MGFLAMTGKQTPPSFPPRIAGGNAAKNSSRAAGGKACLLALETSGKTVSFAVLDEDRLVCEVLTSLAVQQKDSFPLWISHWLNEIGISMGQLMGVAVSIGPGSFTSLRVGMSLAKGICLARNIPLWAVPTLKAMAHGIPATNHLLCPTTFARKGECYAALYSNVSGELQEVEPPFVADAGTLVEHLTANRLPGGDTPQHDDPLPRPTWIWGEGALALQQDIEPLLEKGHSIQRGDIFLLRASAIARLAQAQIADGDDPAAPDLEPYYLKSFSR